MNRLNRYSFSANKSNTETTPQRAKTLVATAFGSFSDILNASKGIAEYEFMPFSELLKDAETKEEKALYTEAAKFGANVKSLKVLVSEMNNGTARNKGVATLKSGNVINVRIWNDKIVAAESKIADTEMLKKVVWGFCKSGAEFATADGTQPAIYADIRALLDTTME